MQLLQCHWQRLIVVSSLAFLVCLYAVDFLKLPSLPNLSEWVEPSQTRPIPQQEQQQQLSPNVVAITSTDASSLSDTISDNEEKVLGLTVHASEDGFRTANVSTDSRSTRSWTGEKGKELEATGLANVSSRHKWDRAKQGIEEVVANKSKDSEKAHNSAEDEVPGGGSDGNPSDTSTTPTTPSSDKRSSVQFRSASWLADVGEWLSVCAVAPPIRVKEVLGRSLCANNCSGHGICNYELAECRCFHGYSGATCELEKDFECNLESESVDQPYGPWRISICAAACDKRRAFCYCGQGTKYPNRPVAEHCAFSRVNGSDWRFDISKPDPYVFTNATTGFGWCNVDPADFKANTIQIKKDCFCVYDGSEGSLCEVPVQSMCYSQCSGNGFCRNGFCACQDGWYGMDCSIPSLQLSRELWPAWLSTGVVHLDEGSSETGQEQSITVLVERQRPLIYVYDLPPEFNSLLMEGRHFKHHCVVRVYNQQNHTFWNGQLYGSENAFLESLLASKHRTNNAEEADFFYVPVLGACAVERANVAPHMSTKKYSGLRTYFSGDFYRKAYEHIKTKYPYWDRFSGRDHIWLFPWDEGACVSPKEIWNSMMLVHWGNTNSKYNFSTTQYRWDTWDPIPLSWRGSHPCYDPQKDLVLPAWKRPDPYPLYSKWWTRGRAERPVLFYFRGNLGNKYVTGRPEVGYSMGIRQRLADEFGTDANKEGHVGRQAAPDVKVLSSKSEDYSRELASSRFCGVLPGDGWSGRMEDSVLHGCIPVIVQDGIHLPFENALDYSKFTVRVAEIDIPQLVAILRSISDAEVDAMQSEVQKVWQRFTYHRAVRMEAERQEVIGRYQKGDQFEPEIWATEFSSLTDDDAFDTFVQVLTYKLGQQQSWRGISYEDIARNATSHMGCRNYSYHQS